jgi:hypothetical protein
MLLLCMIPLRQVQGQKADAPSAISVRRLESVRLIEEQRRPGQVEIKVTLQTGGFAVSTLRMFYRSSADSAFQEVLCELLPSLKYYARIPYHPLIEYYFVATPFVGGTKTFGAGTIPGAGLKSRAWSRNAPKVACVGAAIITTLVSVLTNSDKPEAGGGTRARRHGPAIDVGAVELVGGITASVIYLRPRYKRHKEHADDRDTTTP